MTENIEDRIALQDVMTRYAIAVDDKDYEGYRVLFTEDVHVLGLTPKDMHGMDEFFPWWKNAIDQYRIVGIETTLDFCRFVMDHDAFRSGKFDTHFVNDHYKPEMLDEMREDELEVAAIAGVLLRIEESAGNGFSLNNEQSNWRTNRLN